MADYLSIPKAQTVSFIRTDNDSLTIPTRFNRLFVDQEWYGETNHFYFQKIQKGDTIKVRITSNYTGSSNVSTLYKDAGDNTDTTIYTGFTMTEIYDYADGSGRKQYEASIATSGYAVGKYYFKLEATGSGKTSLIFLSEWLEIIDDDSDRYVKITWSGHDYDGVYYSSGSPEFTLWVEGKGVQDSGTNTESYDDFAYEKQNLKSIPLSFLNFKTQPIPFYIAEKLQLASAHTTFKINDESYVKKDEAKILPLTKSNMFTFECTYQRKNYEDYINLYALT
jgi:hypothetical protein